MKRSLLFAVVLFTAVTAFAQPTLPGGPWWQVPVKFFVSPGGSDANAGTTSAAPWKTIGRALGDPTVTSFLGVGIPVTINLMPGEYSLASNGELFPIALPARNVSLEAWAPGVVFRGFPDTDLIVVSSPGVPSSISTDTVIRGIELTNGDRAIEIDPGLSGGRSVGTDRVHVLQCDIHDNSRDGIKIIVEEGWRGEHVIEDNDVYNHTPSGWGIILDNFGASSSVIRSNRLYDNEVNVQITDWNEAVGVCAPRVQSNLIWEGEWNSIFQFCSPWIVNNTLAFARPHSSGQHVYGVIYNGTTGEQMTLANNIIWNPDPGFGATDVAATGTSVVCDSNDILLGTGPCAPGVNGNTNVNPQFVLPAAPYDLHLLTTSPVIGLGNPAFVHPPLSLTVDGTGVPADLRQDVDLDPRAIDFGKNGTASVDMGGDEVTEVRLSPASGVDALGNLLVSGGAFASTYTITGRPGDTYLVFYSFSFALDPDFNNLFLNPYGNVLLDLAALQPVASGTIGVGGSATFSFNGTLNPVPDEFEVFLQGVVLTSPGLGDATNRLRLELNL